jgi:CxxC motif-containing protein (DUF1111 family)
MRRLKVVGTLAVWAVALTSLIGLGGSAQMQSGPTEAPTGFRVESNGFAEEFCANQAALAEETALSPAIPPEECNFDTAVEEFTGPEDTAAGVGPIFNGVGCGECHSSNQILGATNQINEKRAGFFNASTGVFTDHPGGSLIQDRAFRAEDQERIDPARVNVIALRSTISVLGDGFVEAVSNTTLQNIANSQPAAQRGLVINVPVQERPGTTRIGRFGHKGQQASLLSFSADAYLNEMGITSPMEPNENTSNGRTVAEPPDAPPGVDDEGVDVALFALFMRSTLAPPVDPVIAASADARAGSAIFNNIGCATCHVRTMVTSAPGTLINGGAARVSRALGNKIIHPFGDFLLHDLGTGDGIVQNGGPNSRNRIRTAALWGLRARGRFMHDGLSFSFQDAIARHGNQGAASRANFNALSPGDRNRLLVFLSSL